MRAAAAPGKGVKHRCLTWNTIGLSGACGEPGALKGARRVREAARGNGPALRADTASRADFTGGVCVWWRPSAPCGATSPSKTARWYWQPWAPGRLVSDRQLRTSGRRGHGRGVCRVRQWSLPRKECTVEMTTDPSPTAEATRLTEPARASPTANSPGTEVSKAPCVFTKPLSSS
jgi:hypothetical protein